MAETETETGTEIREGKVRTVEDRHEGGFTVGEYLHQKDGDFGIRFKANPYDGGSPTGKQLAEIEMGEVNCKNVFIHWVDVHMTFKELRYNCKGGVGV